MKTIYALRRVLLGFALLAAAPAQALTTLTFDDLAFPRGVPVFGFAHPAGVTFTVTPADFNSSDYGADALPGLSAVDGQVLDIAAAHRLDLEFAAPVSSLEFGVAHSSGNLFDIVLVTLFTRNGPAQQSSFFIPPPFSDGDPSDTVYSYIAASPSLALTGLWLDFRGDIAATDTDRFQIDNLTFQTAPVPEPSTYAMLMAGLLLLGWTAIRRRQS